MAGHTLARAVLTAWIAVTSLEFAATRAESETLKHILGDFTPPAKPSSDKLQSRIEALEDALQRGIMHGAALYESRARISVYLKELQRRQSIPRNQPL